MKDQHERWSGMATNAAQRVGHRVSAAADSAKALAVVASEATAGATRTAAAGVQSGLETAKGGVVGAAQVTGQALRTAGSVAGAVGSSVVRTAATVGTTLLDQNGDGQLDQADVKIATEKTVAAVKAVVGEVATTDLAKDAAAGAAIGAVIAVPIPFVGPLAGAVVGAAVGSISSLRRKK